MAIQKFEGIVAWHKAQYMSVEVYAHFRILKDYGIRDQICRASVSVSNNIAEGFDRSSHADFRRFFYISLASCSEVKSMLYLAERLKYLKEATAIEIRGQCSEISKIINGLIKSLN